MVPYPYPYPYLVTACRSRNLGDFAQFPRDPSHSEAGVGERRPSYGQKLRWTKSLARQRTQRLKVVRLTRERMVYAQAHLFIIPIYFVLNLLRETDLASNGQPIETSHLALGRPNGATAYWCQLATSQECLTNHVVALRVIGPCLYQGTQTR
jgi:hypothetical protein